MFSFQLRLVVGRALVNPLDIDGGELSRRSPHVPATTRLAVAAAAIAACLLPTFQHAPAQAQPELAPKTNGRIYVNAALRFKADGQDEEQTQHNLLIAIDPATGEWQLIVEDGTQERRLTENGLNVYARFSPDGTKILYLHQTGKDGNSIWTVDIDGKNAKQIVKEVGLASPDGAFWSPDGKQIAVMMFNWQIDEKGQKVRDINSDTTDFRIEIMDADGANRRRLKLAGAEFMFIGSLGDWR